MRTLLVVAAAALSLGAGVSFRGAASRSIDPTVAPVLLVTDAGRPMTLYLGEILRAEGFPSFDQVDESVLAGSDLRRRALVVVGDATLSAGAVAHLADFAESGPGAHLVLMRPTAATLLSLAGLSTKTGELAGGYVDVDTTTAPGLGITGETMQFHGAADRYSSSTGVEVAELFSDATTATGDPAVVISAVTGGGTVAAWTFDLARSVRDTRQGDPARAGTDHDGNNFLATSDFFFNSAAPHWADENRWHIPQADEHGRLLTNVIAEVLGDNLPLPRSWYLPDGHDAMLALTGDNHNPDLGPPNAAAIGARLDAYEAEDPVGCSVAAYECVRATAFMLHDYGGSEDLNAYEAKGHEISLHAQVHGATPTPHAVTKAQVAAGISADLSSFATNFPALDAPLTNRTHAVLWGVDYDGQAEVFDDEGVELDMTYYPLGGGAFGLAADYVGGTALPMRFAREDGTPLDAWQVWTHLLDGAQTYPADAAAMFDAARGSSEFYGVVVANMHLDEATGSSRDDADALVTEAVSTQSPPVPFITAAQLLSWLDARDAVAWSRIYWQGGRLYFTVDQGAAGLHGLVQQVAPCGSLSWVERDGSPVSTSAEQVKGVYYLRFALTAGSYVAGC